MSDTNYLSWPFFALHHEELARTLDSWATVHISQTHGHDVDAECKALVRSLGNAGWLKYAVGGSAYGGPGAIPGSLETTVIPATKTRGYYVLVSDDPNIVYSIQEGGSGSALDQTSLSLNFNLKSGTNSGYVSGWLLDNATGNTGSTRQLQLLGLVQTADNAMGTYAKWKVRINYHSYTTGQAGV